MEKQFFCKWLRCPPASRCLWKSVLGGTATRENWFSWAIKLSRPPKQREKRKIRKFETLATAVVVAVRHCGRHRRNSPHCSQGRCHYAACHHRCRCPVPVALDPVPPVPALLTPSSLLEGWICLLWGRRCWLKPAPPLQCHRARSHRHRSCIVAAAPVSPSSTYFRKKNR